MQAFCLFCNKYKNIEKRELTFRCLACGTWHMAVERKGTDQRAFVAVVKLGEKYFRKVFFYKEEEVSRLVNEVLIAKARQLRWEEAKGGKKCLKLTEQDFVSYATSIKM